MNLVIERRSVPVKAFGHETDTYVQGEPHYFIDGVEVTLDMFVAAKVALLERRTWRESRRIPWFAQVN